MQIFGDIHVRGDYIFSKTWLIQLVQICVQRNGVQAVVPKLPVGFLAWFHLVCDKKNKLTAANSGNDLIYKACIFVYNSKKYVQITILFSDMKEKVTWAII
ncbi:MAG: hypothetical protein DWQ05_15380 [Calditrichaeota bacterium]|nr:MAG: hypothetical protein DWQ05_15380 [Calditrichota bacterium]